MKNEITLHTRRQFLRSTVLTSALSWTVPSFLANTFAALQAEAADKATQIATGRDSTILVVLQMAGGNDGINTVVPYSNDFYHQARPRLGLASQDLIKLNDNVALHGGMTGFKSLYDAGQLAIVQGVGYPNPNRSHFRSTEIWQTASDSEKFETTAGSDVISTTPAPAAIPTVGINIGRQMPQAFAPRSPRESASITRRTTALTAAARWSSNPIARMNGMGDEGSENSGATIGSITGPSRATGSVLDFLERTSMDAQVSSDEIRAVSAKVENKATYPGGQLGNSLKLVARLIGGGLATRIFYVSQGGYDTHTNQAGQQARLLKELADSVKSFCDDLTAQGNMQRVLLMTFSEFGRRVTENANGGTDHGADRPDVSRRRKR